MPQRNLVVLVLAAAIAWLCHYKARPTLYYGGVMAEALEQVAAKHYVAVEPRKLFENAMSGMVTELDPYSSYISASDLPKFEETLHQEIGGVGVMVEKHADTKRLVISSPLPNTPGHKAGLRAGDVLWNIDEHSTLNMPLEEAVRLMRGAPGSKVRLTVRRPRVEALLDFVVARAKIVIESVQGDYRAPGDPKGGWVFVLKEHPRVGYIRVNSFGDRTVAELAAALKFNGRAVGAAIIDLRGNPGGSLTAAVEACDLFLTKGEIVSTRGRAAEPRVFEADDQLGLRRDLPLVVLIDGGSASASEIVAACLQDHGRAKVVGERSFGKGTVQEVLRLDGGRSALKLTTATYWRPSGKNIHRGKDAKDDEEWGVRPDAGWEFKLTDAERAAVVERRRRLDVFDPGAEATADPGDDAETPPAPPAPIHGDPQLQKAVECAERLIGG